MKTKMQILQGFGQIGGNIILLEGENSRIILDIGVPVTEADGNPTDLKFNDKNDNKYLPDIPDLYKEKPDKKTVILISHAHLDHFGLLKYINKSIPVYATKITKKLIKKCSKLLYDNLFDDIKIKEIKDSLNLPDFIIECIPVNHSIAGACAYTITDKKTNKTIFYTGDLRLHGRSIQDIESVINPDYMIIEGTTLSRENQEKKTEQDIENEMTEVFKEDKMSIVCCSPLNTDRLLSVYNACKRSDKTLVIDPYTAYILEIFRGSDLPDYESENIKVYCAPNSHSKKIFKNPRNKKFGINKILFKEIMKEPEKYVIKDNFKVSSSIEKRKNINDINLVYSYWEGYLKDEKYRWSKYKNSLKLIHTTGHIVKDDLIKLIKKIQPKQIIPVHTLANNKFQEYFGEKVLFANKNTVIEINDQ